MEDKKVRGSVVLGYLNFIKRTWGSDGLEECTDSIGLPMKHFEEIQWYNIDILKKIHQWIADEKGEKYIKRGGNYTVKDLGVLSYIVKFVNIKALLKKAPKSYEDAYNFGSVEIDIKDKKAIIKMEDVSFDEYACSGWLGAFEGMLEMTHTWGEVKEVQCQYKGASYCEFEMTWK